MHAWMYVCTKCVIRCSEVKICYSDHEVLFLQAINRKGVHDYGWDILQKVPFDEFFWACKGFCKVK